MQMTATLKKIELWPLDDQIELVQMLWDRIVDSGWQPELTEEQRGEFDRRLAALDANPDDVLTWEQIVRHVRRER
jgi:putative addiction module component (TIGR02574 family)